MRLIGVGVAAAALAVLAQSSAHLLDLWLYDLDVERLNANENGSVFDWLSTVAILAAAVAAASLAILQERRGAPALLAVILLFLFVDDLLQLHERDGGSWDALLALVLIAATALLLRLAAAAQASTRLTVLVGLGLLALSIVTGKVGEVLLSRGGWDTGDLPHEVKVVLKQGAELGGWILIAFALAALVGAASPASRRRESADELTCPQRSGFGELL
jgi:hypothetical protein